MVDQTARRVGHETRDINVRVVMWFAIGLIVAAVIIHFALGAIFAFFSKTHPSPEAPSRIMVQPRIVAPEPRLQTNPSVDLAQFREAEENKLNSYGWVDKQRGIVRIPIERAMDLIVQRGLPTRGPGSHDSSGKTPEQMRQEKAIPRK
jgi:hypothetical protein